MRDPNRIDPLLAKLRAYWLAHPDLRLGQIVTNLSPMRDPFYVDDSEIVACLDAKLAKMETAPPVGGEHFEKIERLPAKRRSCNRHDDCDAADAKARASGRHYADHCDDDCCEDCFGS